MNTNYRLTQQDIDKYGLTDAMVGDFATIADLRKIEGQLRSNDQQVDGIERALTLAATAMPAGVSGTEVKPTSNVAAPSKNSPIDPSKILGPDAPVSEQVTGTTAPLTQTLQSTPAATQRPQDDLTPAQRALLRSAAIFDVGAVLQGKEGGAVQSVLADFTERRDQDRKAAAAQQRNDALAQLYGMGGGTPTSPTGMPTLEGYNPLQERQKIMNAVAQRLIEPAEAKLLLDQVTANEGRLASASRASSMIGDIDNLLSSKGFEQILGAQGIATGALESLNLGALLPDAQEARSILEKIQGDVFLIAFESLKGGGQITELEGRKAEQAGARLKTTQSPEAFREALDELRFYSDIARRRALGENIPPDTIYERKVKDTQTTPAPTDDDTGLESFYSN